jgi:hypothetical protein
MSELGEQARRYHAAIRRILLQEWDPIGVAHIAGAQDEWLVPERSDITGFRFMTDEARSWESAATHSGPDSICQGTPGLSTRG